MSATTTESMMKLTIEAGPLLFQFTSKTHWVNKGASWYRSVPKHRHITVDSLGRICAHGIDFTRAETEGTYPISVYAIDRDPNDAFKIA